MDLRSGYPFWQIKNGLAYIGASPELPNAYFALGYGGNGITYSMIAAGIIADLYLGMRTLMRRSLLLHAEWNT